jgi:hypothetical protein
MHGMHKAIARQLGEAAETAAKPPRHEFALLGPIKKWEVSMQHVKPMHDWLVLSGTMVLFLIR